MTRWITALVALVALVASTALWAQPQPPPHRGDAPRRPGGAPPANADANGDCIVDGTEARLAAEKRVDFGRKMVTRLRERAKENPEAPVPPLLAELDSDHNLDVSDTEAQAAVHHIMADLQKRNAIVLKYFDTDKDGTLNATELPPAKTAFAFMDEVRPELGERPGQMARQRPGEGQRSAAGRRPTRGGEPRPPPPAPPQPPPADEAP